MIPSATYLTADEARDAAIEFQHWQSEQSLSYGELLTWQTHWENVLNLFPELTDEFRENGIC